MRLMMCSAKSEQAVSHMRSAPGISGDTPAICGSLSLNLFESVSTLRAAQSQELSLSTASASGCGSSIGAAATSAPGAKGF
eukprot:6198131-Pleurochrysis_carterae.AAC.2